MGLKEKRGASIDSKILSVLNKEAHPISTRDLGIKAKLSWHTVINHCLRLQMANKLDGYKIGNLNVWCLKK
jgi:DNA-binding Lrp family transcriptional regulator